MVGKGGGGGVWLGFAASTLICTTEVSIPCMHLAVRSNARPTELSVI